MSYASVKSRLPVMCLAVALAAAAVSLPARRASAQAIITVNEDDDELNQDGDCSVREATRSANQDFAFDACVAGDGSQDQILIPAGTYTLDETGTAEDFSFRGDLDIIESVTIIGAGKGLTIIDGNGPTTGERVLDIFDPATVTMSALTIRGGGQGSGEDGGGIRVGNNANLNLSNAVIENNAADDEGGGLYNDGSTVLEDVTIRNNDAAEGAGIRTVDDLTMSYVSIVSNDATDNGGGLSSSGTPQITTATVSENTADEDGGGVYLDLGTATFLNVTIGSNTADDDSPTGAGDGGGVMVAGGTLNFENTLIGDNTDASVALKDPDCNGTLTSQDYNLVEDVSSNCSIVGQTGHNVTGMAPLLDPTADDNGGSTPTQALQAGSPAIDAGNDASAPFEDQRGVPRPRGAASDIGSYEYMACRGDRVNRVGTSGRDRMTGTPADEVFATFGGNDVVDAGGGNDTICTGAGHDRILPGLGDDRLTGGPGDDVLVFEKHGDGVRVRLTDRRARGQGHDNVKEVEDVIGTNERDVLRGNGEANRLLGLNGNDDLFGLGGSDVLLGGAGRDFLDGGPDDDRCDGGPGFDHAESCSDRSNIP